MSERTCSVDGCEKPHHSQGYCKPHYSRWKRVGDPTLILPTAPIRGLTLRERMWRHIEVVDGHWLWTGGKTGGGYGRISVGARSVATHRLTYEMYFGPIDDGLHIDHLCRVRACCYPGHLEAVTPAENNRRSSGSGGLLWNGVPTPPAVALAERNWAKTHCPQGHPYDEANTIPQKGGKGRKCAACQAGYMRRRTAEDLAARRLVACPECGAMAGSPCVAPSGNRYRSRGHRARTAAAQSAVAS